MTAEIVPLPPRAAPLGADLLPQLQASLRVLELIGPPDQRKPPPRRLTVAQQREQAQVVIDLAEALGVNLRAAAALQEQGCGKPTG